MERLTTSRKLLAIITFAAVLWAPSAARAADRTPANLSPLVTPRPVSAIGGGSIEPGGPRAQRSFSLTDATGGGPGFPTRPLATNNPARTAGATAAFEWTTVLSAAIAFAAGAMSATVVGHRRSRRAVLAA
jgi:hypothetical protein